MTDVYTLARFDQYEIERMFAATAMQFPVYTFQVAGWLPPDMLLNKSVRKFWESLCAGLSPNMTDEQADCVVSQARLDSKVDKEITPEMLDDTRVAQMPQVLANEISRKHFVTAVGSRLSKLYTAVQNSDDYEIKRIAQEISDHSLAGSCDGFDTQSADDMFQGSVMAGNRSIMTHIPNLDKSIGGLERQTEVIIAARPSMGKTALMWQIARNVAETGLKVIFFSLEMSTIALWARAVCPAAGVPWRDVKMGNVTDQQRRALFDASVKLKDSLAGKLFVDDGRHTSETIWRSCATIRPDLVLIDHLRYVKDDGENENKRQGRITERMKDMAKSLNCVVAIAAQLNRGVEERQDKVPGLSDLRDCGEIEENADAVLALYRPDYYDPPPVPTNRHYTELWVRKNRDGVLNVLVKLIFDTGLQRFEQMDDRRAGPMAI